MVYKDADSGYTIAVDGDGNVIKKVLSSLNTDDVVIQAAITYVDSLTNDGSVILKGNFVVGSTVNLPSNISVVGTDVKSTIIRNTSDSVVFLIENVSNSRLMNLSIKHIEAQTNACIKIHATSSYVSYVSIRDVIIERYSGSAYSSTGILLDTTGSAGIFFCDIENVEVNNCSTAIKLNNNTSGAGGGWINGCTLKNISIYYYIIGIDFGGDGYTGTGTYGYSNNHFEDIRMQSFASTTHGIKNRKGSGNVFISIRPWDVPGGGVQCSVEGGKETYAKSVGGFLTYGNSTWTDGRNRDSEYIPSVGKNVVTVAKSFADYSTLYAALASITDASESNQYVIQVYGSITETNLITAKSYVHVIGSGKADVNINTATNGAGINFNGVVHTTWKNLRIRRSGAITSYSHVINCYGACDSSAVLSDVVVVNQTTGAVNYNYGIYVEYTCSNTFNNVVAYGASTGTYCNGISLGGRCTPTLNNCVGFGGSSGTYCCGISISHYASPKLNGCTGYGGSGGTDCYGIAMISNSSCAPRLVGCVGFAGIGGLNSHSIHLTAACSPILEGCLGCYQNTAGIFTYSGAGYSFVPDASLPTFVESISIEISVAGAGGSVLDIGTTDGGTEIAGAISTSSTGVKTFSFSRRAVSAGSSIYAKPTDTSTRFYVYYVVAYNNSSTRGVFLDTTGYAHISNCKFYSNQASSAGYITTTARTAGKFLIENCSFESVGTYDLEGQTSGVVPVYNCTFARGSLSNITLPGQGTAATITAGNTYVDVTHSLASTPTKVRVTPNTNLRGRSFWVDTKGAATFRINIDSTDIIDHTFDWEAEV